MLYQRRVPRRPDGRDGRCVTQDPPRAVGRVHSAEALGCTSCRRSSTRCHGFLAGHVDGDAAGRLAPRISTAICYEVVYPSLMRQAVRGSSELLTTITNDAQCGNSSAPYQHFALASMRAIEQGATRARREYRHQRRRRSVRARACASRLSLNRTALVEQVRFLTVRTIYSRIGDVVAPGDCHASRLA